MTIKYVFVGAEAEGYYSNAYECEGVFLTKEYYEKNKEDVESMFTDRSFYELDGKHSEVEGDLIVKEFADTSELAEFTSDDDVSYEAYHLSGYDDDGIHGAHVDKTYAEVQALISDYKTYTYALTPDQNELVKAFIDELTKEGR